MLAASSSVPISLANTGHSLAIAFPPSRGASAAAPDARAAPAHTGRVGPATGAIFRVFVSPSRRTERYTKRCGLTGGAPLGSPSRSPWHQVSARELLGPPAGHQADDQVGAQWRFFRRVQHRRRLDQGQGLRRSPVLAGRGFARQDHVSPDLLARLGRATARRRIDFTLCRLLVLSTAARSVSQASTSSAVASRSLREPNGPTMWVVARMRRLHRHLERQPRTVRLNEGRRHHTR
jgi:hypothetical protein